MKKNIILLTFISTVVFAQSTGIFNFDRFSKVSLIDSLFLYPKPQQEAVVSDFSFINYSGQVVGGLTGGLLLAYPIALAVGFEGANSNVSGSQALGLISTYVAGTALSMYGIASFENSELSFWDLFGFAGIGGGVGIGVYLSTEGETVAAMLAGPVLGGLVYTIFFPEWEYEKINYDYEEEEITYKSINHFDLVNHDRISFQILRVDL